MNVFFWVMFVDFRVFIWVYMIKKLIGVKFDDMVKRVGEVMVEFDIGFFVVVDENGDVVGFFDKGRYYKVDGYFWFVKYYFCEGDNDERFCNCVFNGFVGGSF